MQLPNRITVGGTRYYVYYTDRPDKYAGTINYGLQTITIRTHRRNNDPYSAAFVRETFWHELTHAILKSMDSPLYRDEMFVTQFSKRLSKAIDSAEFDV